MAFWPSTGTKNSNRLSEVYSSTREKFGLATGEGRGWSGTTFVRKNMHGKNYVPGLKKNGGKMLSWDGKMLSQDLIFLYVRVMLVNVIVIP